MFLVSWIGNTDLRAMAESLPKAKRDQVLVSIGAGPKVEGTGPLRTLIEQVVFEQIHLLSNYDPKLGKQYAAWISRKPVLHQVELKNPTNYGKILSVVRPILDSIKHINQAELCFHLSPGTPAMAAIWILLGKSQFPATLYQSYRGQVSVAEIPFDITIDVLPQLLREPDRFWQHLSTLSPQESPGFESIDGNSPAIRTAVGRAQRAAIHDVPVLILGESGTGKELFAEAIHRASHRRDQPFYAINCAAISKELIESELFGHVKGAFTGADSARQGLFEQAHGSTLFLDEVGECELQLQTKKMPNLSAQLERLGIPGETEMNHRFRIESRLNCALRSAIKIGANCDMEAYIAQSEWSELWSPEIAIRIQWKAGRFVRLHKTCLYQANWFF